VRGSVKPLVCMWFSKLSMYVKVHGKSVVTAVTTPSIAMVRQYDMSSRHGLSYRWYIISNTSISERLLDSSSYQFRYTAMMVS
jgi:hypothetical protein